MALCSAFELQILCAIGASCKPNSPVKGRSWTTAPTAIIGVKEAVHALLAARLLEVKGRCWWEVRPTLSGYKLIESEKEARRERKARPALFAARATI